MIIAIGMQMNSKYNSERTNDSTLIIKSLFENTLQSIFLTTHPPLFLK